MRNMNIPILDYIRSRSVKDSNGCRLWQGSKINSGYGRISARGRYRLVHREVWRQVNGPIPKGMCICHTCDVKHCVNPNHLFLGTYLDNMRDKISKGRDSPARGEKQGSSKLTEDEVRAIRKTRGTQVELGRIYGVSGTTIFRIRHRRIWAHV